MKILATVALAVLVCVSCVSRDYSEHRLRSDVLVNVQGPIGGQITQETLDKAWTEALKVFGGDPKWKCPVTPDRVVYVPAPLYTGDGNQIYGMTSQHPAVIDGKIVEVEVIEIHLPAEQTCAIYTVLVHEMGHCILTRREIVDPNFQKAAAGYKNQEEMVRGLWPAMKINGLVCK